MLISFGPSTASTLPGTAVARAAILPSVAWIEASVDVPPPTTKVKVTPARARAMKDDSGAEPYSPSEMPSRTRVMPR